MTEEEIAALLEDWTRKYLKAVQPHADAALATAQETVATYLRSIRFSDFASAAEFADKLFDLLQTVYRGEWESASAAAAIRAAGEAVYRYYRTKDDVSILPEGEAIRIKFGGIDKRSLDFFEKLDKFYFSKYLNNNEPGLKRYFADEWIAKGGRSTVDLTPEQIEEIRAALGARLKNVNDVNLERIVRGATVRTRNWAHINRLREGRVELARIVAVIDERTSEICKFLDGKFLRVKAAADAVDRLSQLEPGDYAKEVFESPAAKAFKAANNNAEEVEKFFDGQIDKEGVLDDSLMAAGYGFPPYHVSCRTRITGEIVVAAAPSVQPEPPAPQPEAQAPKELTASEARQQVLDIEKEYVGRLTPLKRKRDQAAKLFERRMSDQNLRADFKQAHNEFVRTAEEALERMRAVLAVAEPVAFNVTRPVGSDTFNRVVEAGVAAFNKLVSNPALKGKTLRVREIKERANYFANQININAANEVRVVVHEMGHWLEDSDPEVLRRVVEFFERRTKGEKSQRLKDLFPKSNYEEQETTLVDHFLHPYMGKAYRIGGGQIYATELVSMGLEWMYADPSGLAAADPELFDLIYEIARLKPKE